MNSYKFQRRIASANSENLLKESSFVDFKSDGNVGYRLRENPKKTWRISGSSYCNLHQVKVCKDCGKKFQSWKSLFDHLRSHTQRFHPGLVNEDLWKGRGACTEVSNSTYKSIGAGARKRRQSRSSEELSSPSFTCANATCLPASDIDQEKEDLAICLMMLSRDEGSWGGLNFVETETSDNSSVVLGVISSGINTRVAEKSEDDFTDKISSTNDMKAGGKRSDFDHSDVRYAHVDNKRARFGDSKFGGLPVAMKAKLHVVKNESKKSTFDGDDDEFEENGTGLEANCQFLEYPCRKDGSFQSDTRLSGGSFNRTQVNSIVEGSNSVRSFKPNTNCSSLDDERSKDQQKKTGYECVTCNKSFHSYQALGGHKASHKKIKECFAAKTQLTDSSLQTEIAPKTETEMHCKLVNLIDAGEGGETFRQPKKVTTHKCPICGKVFASGQALGGHKRSHLIGDSGSKTKAFQPVAIQQKPLDIFSRLLDLNLPAPVDDYQ